MLIRRLELENIKSHRHSSLQFEAGTTAIVGPNGAGKTTIIEAIAWVLFDVLDYTKEDFITRGAKKGTVKISLVSSLDEREYTLVRDTNGAYYVQDPQLGTRIANRKEEVTRFLWQHLGVEPGTDLPSLFKEAIGVPQGTLTAIFKATPAQRKLVFDTLLKVEEYREGAEKLKATRDHINGQIQAVRMKIANAEGQLDRYDGVKEEAEKLSAEFAKLADEVSVLESETSAKKEEVAKLDEILSKAMDVKKNVDKLTSGKSNADIVLAQKESEAKRARAAAEILENVREENEKHLKAVGMLKELERERAEREKLSEESRKIETAEIRLKSDQKRLSDELAKAHAAAKEIEILRPKVSEQERLEAEVQKLRDVLADMRGKQQLLTTLENDIARLREDYKKNQADIRKAEELTAATVGFETARTRDGELTAEITRLRTQVEYDEKFQKEIRGGLCPILSAKCLNLKEGETLEGFLKDQFKELRSRIRELESEQNTVKETLKAAAGAERAAGTLVTLKENEARIADEGKRLAAEKDRLLAEMPDAAQTQKEFDGAEKNLKALGDARSKITFLERESAREGEIRDALGEIEKNFERLETDRKELAESIAKYKDLDANWKHYSAERDATVRAHQEFIRNEPDAKSLTTCESALAEAREAVATLSGSLARAESELADALKGYDSSRHDAQRAALIDADRRLTAARTNLSNAETQRKRAEDELARLEGVRKSMRGEQLERERLEYVGEVTDFIRTTLKEAAPRVARNYVYHIALEAAQMFREITGSAERTLKWSEDYGIQLEEDGHDRPFANLSGGEQMSAALSVRLALLKQLSDIRVAFFDEPTTNMDLERRERLAEQVSQITHKKTFEQLFIISHDDTFEHYVDNVLALGDD